MKLATLREYLQLSESIADYSILQKAFITAWGRLLYMSYDSLPFSSNGNLNDRWFLDQMKEYLSDPNDDNMNGWIDEGCKQNGREFISKSSIDKVFELCEVKLTSEMKVYKSGNGQIDKNRWISVCAKSGKYNHLGEEKEYTLKPGTKVIYTYSMCDKDEIIINTSQL